MDKFGTEEQLIGKNEKPKETYTLVDKIIGIHHYNYYVTLTIL